MITGGERRPDWSIEQKREIAAESLQPGMGPSGGGRRYGISSGLRYTWRRQLTKDRRDRARPGAKFARDVVMGVPAQPPPATIVAAAAGAVPPNR